MLNNFFKQLRCMAHLGHLDLQCKYNHCFLVSVQSLAMFSCPNGAFTRVFACLCLPHTPNIVFWDYCAIIKKELCVKGSWLMMMALHPESQTSYPTFSVRNNCSLSEQTNICTILKTKHKRNTNSYAHSYCYPLQLVKMYSIKTFHAIK